MSRWELTIIVIAWAFFITVSPYPAVLEDNLFYTDESTIPEGFSVSAGLSTPDLSPVFDENDGIGAGVSPGPALGDLGYPSEDMNLWAGGDAVGMPSLGVSSETNDGDLTPMDNLIALDPPDCLPDFSKQDKPIDLALGDQESKICAPQRPPPLPEKTSPLSFPVLPRWACPEGLLPHCCVGGLQENQGRAMECRLYKNFDFVFCSRLWITPLCCKGVDEEKEGYGCVEPDRVEEE